jgi:hypothetical protein
MHRHTRDGKRRRRGGAGAFDRVRAAAAARWRPNELDVEVKSKTVPNELIDDRLGRVSH